MELYDPDTGGDLWLAIVPVKMAEIWRSF